MKLFSILKKDLLILIRNKADMAVLFLMPLAFIIPISLALGSGDGYGISRNNRMIPLPVINQDGGPRAQDLLASVGESLYLEYQYNEEQIKSLNLEDDPACMENISTPVCHELTARTMLSRSQRSALILIPPGFSQAVDNNEPADIILLFDPAGDAIEIQQIEGIVKGAATRISVKNKVASGLVQLNNLIVYAPDDVRQSMQNDLAQPPAQDQQPVVQLRKVAPDNSRLTQVPNTYEQTIPGYTVMFVFFIITSMAGSIRQEKLNGTFRRLLSSPTSRTELLGGKLIASLLIGLIQVFVLFLVGVMLFGLRLGEDPLAFFLLTTALVLAAACLGLAVSETSYKGSGMAAPLIISALIGGCMFPIDLMPAFLRMFSYAVPHSWALRGYQNLMVRGMGVQEVLPQIGMLLVFAGIFFFFAIWRFRFDD